MDSTIVAIVLFFVCVGVLMVTVAMSFRIVPEWARMVVYRWGRTGPELVKGPGLRFTIPIADRGLIVDLREQRLPVRSIVCRTADDCAVRASYTLRCQILDPLKSQLNVLNYANALRGVSGSLLTKILAEANSDQALFHPEKISATLREQLEEVVRRWGGTVLAIEEFELSRE